MDLFDDSLKKIIEKEQPLAARMRPRTLEDFAGQENIIGRGRLLYRAIKADQISSLIFYGPPGTGKTTLAAVIANTTKSNFITVNAVLSGVKEIREAIEASKNKRKLYNQRTILFVDEVHRWNKAQQDALLPWVENGTIILIGATTENPFFEVNRALVSRSRIFQLKTLTENDLKKIVFNVLKDKDRGYGNINVKIDDDALDHLVKVSGGDARSLLNALELAVETTPDVFPPEDGKIIHVTLSIAEDSIQRKAVLYDKEGDYHFDTISAFIKSLRGSDPDAALYWCAKMIYAGENPRFIFRRMLIFASEDIGLADPNALIFTEAAASAFDRVGMPEGRYHIANTVLYLATAPKSNSVMAFFDALNTVENESNTDVPNHLRDANRDKQALGHGEGYLYPHSYREHWIAQQYLPDILQGKMFYNPGEIGYEAKIKQNVERYREIQLASFIETQNTMDEVLTFSPPDKALEKWYIRAAGNVNKYLVKLKDKYFDNILINRHDLCLDLSGDNHIFTWELLRKAPEGAVWTAAEKQSEAIMELASRFPELNRPVLLDGGVKKSIKIIKDKNDIFFDLVTARNLIQNNDFEVLGEINSIMSSRGILYIMESAPFNGQRLSGLSCMSELEKDLFIILKKAEEEIFCKIRTNYLIGDINKIEDTFKKYGYKRIEIDFHEISIKRRIDSAVIEEWFSDSKYLNGLNSYMNKNQIKILKSYLHGRLSGKDIDWIISTAFLKAFNN